MNIKRFLEKTRIRIEQIAKNSNNVSQTVNILITEDEIIKKYSEEVIDFSLQNDRNFQFVTNLLQNMKTDGLDELNASLISNWLRKVVAANHINYTKSNLHYEFFQLIMFDTSLYDQEENSWLDIPEFKKVVDFDSLVSKHFQKKGIVNSVFRVFFIPDRPFLEKNFLQIKAVIVDQVSKHISCALVREDLISLEVSEEIVGDFFLIKGNMVCPIEKPYWQFELLKDKSKINFYYEKFKAVMESQYTLVLDNSTIHELDPLVNSLLDI